MAINFCSPRQRRKMIRNRQFFIIYFCLGQLLQIYFIELTQLQKRQPNQLYDQDEKIEWTHRVCNQIIGKALSVYERCRGESKLSATFFFRFSYFVIRFFSMRLLFFYAQQGSGKLININPAEVLKNPRVAPCWLKNTTARFLSQWLCAVIAIAYLILTVI